MLPLSLSIQQQMLLAVPHKAQARPPISQHMAFQNSSIYQEVIAIKRKVFAVFGLNQCVDTQ